MSTKTKTTAAAAIAALALPSIALAEDGETTSGKKHGKDRAAEVQKRNAERKSERQTQKSKRVKSKAFVVKGVDASGLTVTDGALAGALTLDPTSANKHARRALELTKTELAGEDTVTFGEAGDKVRIKYEGLQSTDALQPTDVVKVIGKVNREGEINIRQIKVTRGTETETETPETEKTERS